MARRGVECVGYDVCASNPAILHRDFVRWSGVYSTTEGFVAPLGRLEFGLDGNGMPGGMILRGDFVAARWHERSVKDLTMEQERKNAMTTPTIQNEPDALSELIRLPPPWAYSFIVPVGNMLRDP